MGFGLIAFGMLAGGPGGRNPKACISPYFFRFFKKKFGGNSPNNLATYYSGFPEKQVDSSLSFE